MSRNVALRSAAQNWLLILAAVFAIVWSVVRAHLQSVTQDEADTYFWFASKPASHIFYPFPNNHVLNTLLMWITTRVFGLSALSLRMPALLGAVIYVSACYSICRRITSRFQLQFPVFICLVYNPLILDFMAAARGYSLANAFLMTALAIPLWHSTKDRPSLPAACALGSLSLGLSFASTFAFAFVDVAAFLALVTWAIRARQAESVPRILAACILPGLLIALILCGYPLSHWPKGELLDSARSLGEMMRSLIDASLYQLPPLLRESIANDVKPFLLPALGILCLGQLVAARSQLAMALMAIIAVTLALHWLTFHFRLLPLPMTRTAIFFIPLCILAAAAITAKPQWLTGAASAAFLCLAFYSLLCLRLTYFQEYQDDADMKDVYPVLARLNHQYGVTGVAMDGLYVSPLNFYRALSAKETFPEFLYVSRRDFPAGKSIYVLHGGYSRDFIAKEKLAIVYRGKSTEVVVAVKPGGPIPVPLH